MSYLPLHPGLRISVSQVEFLPWIEKKLKSYSKYFSSVFLNCISQCGTCGRECCNLLLNYVACCVSQSYVSAVFLKLRHFWNVFLKSLYFWNVFVTLRHFWNVFLKKSISEMYFSKKKYFWNVFLNGVFPKCISQHGACGRAWCSMHLTSPVFAPSTTPAPRPPYISSTTTHIKFTVTSERFCKTWKNYTYKIQSSI